MNCNNGRLLLKVKKRRNSFPVTKTIIQAGKENIHVKNTRGQKRLNPFSTMGGSSEKLKNLKIEEKCEEQSRFLLGLDQYDKASQAKEQKIDISTKYKPNNIEQNHDINDTNVTNDQKSLQNYSHVSQLFPLDWCVKQKVRIISTKPFNIKNIKSADECEGIHQFISNSQSNNNICQSLYNWTHPSIPGVPNFPLVRKTTVGVDKEDKIISILANDIKLQDVVMKQWQNSFQSLFNMLKMKYCPYFYLCSHQFTILFKSSGTSSNTTSAVMTPTTKGLRDLLSEDGISFDLIHESQSAKKEADLPLNNEEEGEEYLGKSTSLNNSYEEDFLDSIGLNKKEHFPSIEAQQRLVMKSQLRSIDNKAESTIKIKNCQGLFNFLRNANFLCASSGIMTGVPPTLISPAPFEGGTISKCRITNAPMKHQRKSSIETIYCVDVSGVIMPHQVNKLVECLTKNNTKNDSIRIQMKSYDLLHSLNDPIPKDNFGENDKMRVGVDETKEFLEQQPLSLSDKTEIHFIDNLFKF